MSALPPKADIGTQSRDVRFVPKADIRPLIRSTRRHAPETSREIDDKLKLRRLLDRDFGELRSAHKPNSER